MRLLGRALAILLLAALAAAGALVWRIQRGPIALDFLIPRLKAALAEGGGWNVDVEGLELVWRAAARHAELRARGLRITRPNEGTSVTLAEVRIRLNRRALLRGEVMVVGIELDAPELDLVRDVAGRFAMHFEGTGHGASDLGWLWAMMQRLELVAVRSGRVAFSDEATGTRWTVPHLDGDVWRAGGPLRVQGELALEAGDATVPLWFDAFYRFDADTLTAQVSSAGADTRTAFAAWPSTLASKAHEWVTTHLKDGRIGASVLALTGHVVRDPAPKLAVDAVDASVAFEGLSVRYLDTMPPATGVDGRAQFTQEGVDVKVTTGKLDALAVGPARVRVAWPPKEPNRIAIDARCRGPLASLAGVLDNEPVALGQRVSFQTHGLAGTTASRIRLAFPLEGRHALGTLGLHGVSTLTDATVPGVAGGWDVARGNVTILVDDRALALDGTAMLGGVPVAIRIRDHFKRPALRRIDVAGRLEEADRKMLGIDAGPSITGPLDARIRLSPRPEGRMVAKVDADLTAATLAVPVLAIDKVAEAPGRVVARLAIARGVVSAIERFDVSAGAVTVRGSAGRPPAGGPWNRVDATATFALPDRDDLGALQLGLQAQDAGWRATAASRDVGLVLRAYGIDRVRGGRMTLDGRIEQLTGDTPFEGQVTIENVTLSHLPWLVKVVSLASIRGLRGLGSEKNVAFDRVVATLARRDSRRIEIRGGVARGPQMGLTLDGTFDESQDTLHLQGTVVPSYYLLNEGVEQIPVIGKIIGHATGGAIQAVTFTVRGPRTDPSVAVQPLSSLAPGKLREWLRKLGL